MRYLTRLLSWVFRGLIANEAESDYYAWADTRLDELAEEARRKNGS